MARIAFVDLLFHWPPSGGSWVHLKEVIEGLARRGHEVRLFVPHFARYQARGVILSPPSFSVERIPFGAWSFNRLQVPRQFTRAIDHWKPDIVSLDDGYFMKTWLVRPLAKQHRVFLRLYGYEILCAFNKLLPNAYFSKENHWLRADSICTNHILKDWRKCRRCFMPLRRPVKYVPCLLAGFRSPASLGFVHEYLMALAFTRRYVREVESALQLAERVVVYSAPAAEMVRPYARQVNIAPPGVWPGHFDSPPPDSRTACKTILFTGRASDQVKGLAILRAALNILRARRRDFTLLVTEPPGPWTPRYEEACLPIGWLTQEELPRLYRLADICVVPSVWPEPFGITALEAMAASRPVIASRTGGLAESVVHGQTGLLVEPGDILGLSEAVETLLDDGELRVRLGQAGRSRVEAEYDWDRVIDRYYAPLFES